MSLNGLSAEERFKIFAKPDPATGCIFWAGHLVTGYGSIRVGQRRMKAHVYAYLRTGKTIPDDCELDHLCRIKNCVNDRHLEPVIHSINILRGRRPNAEKTHCPQGHPYDERNVYARKGRTKGRLCRECIRTRGRERYRKRITK